MIDPIFHNFIADDIAKHSTKQCDICGLRLSHRGWCAYGRRVERGIVEFTLTRRVVGRMKRMFLRERGK